MNCQQICKISCKKSTQVKIFQKVLGGATFFETPCRTSNLSHLYTLTWQICIYCSCDVTSTGILELHCCVIL